MHECSVYTPNLSQWLRNKRAAAKTDKPNWSTYPAIGTVSECPAENWNHSSHSLQILQPCPQFLSHSYTLEHLQITKVALWSDSPFQPKPFSHLDSFKQSSAVIVHIARHKNCQHMLEFSSQDKNNGIKVDVLLLFSYQTNSANSNKNIVSGIK